MGTRYSAWGKETVYGTAVAASRYAEAIAGIKPDHNWVIPDPVFGRAYRKRNLGPYRARGPVGPFPVEPENIGEILLAALGSVSTTNPISGVYLHVFSPADLPPSLTVRLGVELTERILPGCLLEDLKLKIPNDKDVEATAQFLSGFPETSGSIGTPTASALQALTVASGATMMTLEGSDRKNVLFDSEIQIQNKWSDRGNLGGRTLAVKRIGNRTVLGKLSTNFDDVNEYTRFINGTPFTLVHQVAGPEIVENYPYYLKLELRKCVYKKDGVPDVKNQGEPLVVDAPFQAFYDTTGAFNAEIKATLQNTIASY